MKFFFVLSLGRSGTKRLAGLLNTADNAVVFHEPYAYDPQILSLSLAGNRTNATASLLDRRFEQVLGGVPDGLIYGEANSYLRENAAWLRSTLDATIVCIARDGRDFVTSAYPRTVYTPLEHQLPVLPDDDDPIAATWASRTRLEQLAWYWAFTNQRLMSVGHVFQMEKLFTDWPFFRESILAPTGVALTKDQWSEAVGRRINTSRQYLVRSRARNVLRQRERRTIPTIGHWTSWDRETTERFWAIAGKQMHELGYPE